MKRILILGGGFGGVYTALTLEKLLKQEIHRGEVEVLEQTGAGEPTPLRRLGAGECFGEIALVSDRPRSATVRAVRGTSVLAVDREAFHALFGSLPPLRGFFEELIATRDR